MKISMTTRLSLFLLLVSILSAPVAHAASLSVDSVPAATGTVFSVPVRFASEGEQVNVIEGSILVPDGVSIDRIDTGGSVVSLWTERPAYTPATRSISFSGGVPGALPANATVVLFYIRAHASAPGTYVFTPQQATAYRADGSGERIAVNAESSTLSVGEAGSVAAGPTVTVGATPLIAEVGHDDSLFDGKYFATFYGGEAGEGVDHYTVQEGWWRSAERASRYYILKDQKRETTLFVTAVNVNGTNVVAVVSPENPWPERAVFLLMLLVGAVGAFLAWRRIKRAAH